MRMCSILTGTCQEFLNCSAWLRCAWKEKAEGVFPRAESVALGARRGALGRRGGEHRVGRGAPDRPPFQGDAGDEASCRSGGHTGEKPVTDPVPEEMTNA